MLNVGSKCVHWTTVVRKVKSWTGILADRSKNFLLVAFSLCSCIWLCVRVHASHQVSSCYAHSHRHRSAHFVRVLLSKSIHIVGIWASIRRDIGWCQSLHARKRHNTIGLMSHAHHPIVMLSFTELNATKPIHKSYLISNCMQSMRLPTI